MCKINTNRIKKVEEPKENVIQEKDDEVEILTVRLILDENKYYKYFKDYVYNMKFANKIIDYFQKNYDGKKIFKLEEVINLDIFESEEKQKMLDFYLVSYNPYSQIEAKDMLFRELLSSWIRKDINICKKKKEKMDLDMKSKIQLTLYLKSLEIRLGEANKSITVIEIYNEFDEKIKQKFFDI